MHHVAAVAVIALLLLVVLLVGCGSGAICGKRNATTGYGGGPTQGDRTCEVKR